ncbi:MAG: M20 family metallopeptidase [Armatimonadetes bacterium]|nr:M20 family metallopeptidase [Armatimonadota bacterium]
MTAIFDSDAGRSQVISLLQDLVSIESINPLVPGGKEGEGRVAEYLSQLYRQSGIACELQWVAEGRPNVIATLPGQDASRSIAFEAHMDTVTVQGMTIPPFEPKIEGNLLYGRGSCDTKGGLAGMVSALLALRARGIQPKATVHVAATMDEEVGFTGVKHLVDSGFRADAAVVAEPTEMKVVRAHKGAARWQITARGKAAHSSKPHLGINAIDKMADFLVALRAELIPELSRRSHLLVGSPTLNPGIIAGGAQINQVPDTCTLYLDRRLIPGENPASARQEVEALLERMRERDIFFNAALEPSLLEDYALETPEDARIVQSALEACRLVTGEGEIAGVPYGTDASKFSRAGIPSVVFGPGSINMAHGAVEYVEIDQALAAAEVYAQIMLAF